MTQDELTEVLRLHELWLAGDPSGKQANLARANLARANLGGANLVGANLYGANLYGANLYGANLYGANLARANLGGANLVGANLVGANLGGANLGGANLYGANLARANLGGANLGGANLVGADLVEVDLYGANLGGANLDEAQGIIWARVGPIGIGPRELLGVWQGSEGLVIYGGCFRGTPADFRSKVANGGWDWPEDRQSELAQGCLDGLTHIETQVHRWLAACE